MLRLRYQNARHLTSTLSANAVSKTPQAPIVRQFHAPTALNRWFNVPKGFEKYFRRGGKSEPTPNSTGAPKEKVDPKQQGAGQSSDKARRNKTGGTGGSKKPDSDDTSSLRSLGLLAALGFTTLFMVDDIRNGRYV